MEKVRAYRNDENNLKLRKMVYFIFGVLETIFAFRFTFRLLGASPMSAFVSVIYTISGVFITPFSGIFKDTVTNGIETKAVLEPTTIIIMIVYALIANELVKLIKICQAPIYNEIE